MATIVWVPLVIIALLLAGALYVSVKYRKVDWGHPAANFVDGLIRWYCFRVHRLERHTFAIPQQEGFIICSNHISGIDPFLLLCSIDRPVRFLIAQEEYQRFGLTWLFKLAGCIPVDRKAKSVFQFRQAVKAIAQGEVIGIFPQGGIHLPEEGIKTLKLGAFRLAKLAQCPIYLFFISGIKPNLNTLAPFFRRSHSQIKLLEIIDDSQLNERDWRSKYAKHLIYGKFDT